MFNKIILKTLSFGILVVIVLTTTQCATRSASVLPKDILGIGIGMNRENAEQRLREIGNFMRDEGRRGREQVWVLNDNPSYGHLAIGYDENNQVSYVTAIAKPRNAQPVFFKDVGDPAQAKHDAAGPNHRYIWEVPANGNDSGYQVIAQGGNAESVSLFTLSKLDTPGKDEGKEKKE